MISQGRKQGGRNLRRNRLRTPTQGHVTGTLQRLEQPTAACIAQNRDSFNPADIVPACISDGL